MQILKIKRFTGARDIPEMMDDPAGDSDKALILRFVIFDAEPFEQIVDFCVTLDEIRNRSAVKMIFFHPLHKRFLCSFHCIADFFPDLIVVHASRQFDADKFAA